MQLYQRSDCGIRGFERSITALIDADEDGEVALRRDPDDREVHGVIASVIEHFAAAPTAFCGQPAERVLIVKWRGVECFITGRLQKRFFTARPAKLVLDELRPIRHRTMHAASRAHDGKIVHGRTIELRGFAVCRVRPRLINFSGRACAAETCGSHLQRREEFGFDGIFPGTVGDFFHNRPGDDVTEI